MTTAEQEDNSDCKVITIPTSGLANTTIIRTKATAITPSASMDVEDYKPKRKWFFNWLFNWTSSSPTMLRAVEKRILAVLKRPYRGFYVDIGPAVGESDKIWTISMNTDSKEMPLVMLHGLGAGVALWIMNLDELAKDRPVYAVDILGFGRSSRPKFSNEALTCERQFVKSVEEWRREINLDKMILLGHSMGGFIAASYALSYPDRVQHLILADPWGFPEKPAEVLSNIPFWMRAIGYIITPLNPLWALRAAGPFGQWIVEKTRPDIMRKYSSAINDDYNLLSQYIHQCNAQKPTGESAFHTMMEFFGWAKHPMIHRIKDVRSDIPMSFIYGSRSWIDSSSGEKIKTQRFNSSVDIKIVSGAGHHVYADKPEVFNRYVNDTCNQYKSAYSETPAIPTAVDKNPNDNNTKENTPTVIQVPADRPTSTSNPTKQMVARDDNSDYFAIPTGFKF